MRWFGREILDHDAACVDMARLQEIGVVLYNHERDAVVGKITRAWLEGNRGNAIVEFDDDEESERVCKKVRSGTLKGVSVGYQVSNWETVKDGEKSLDGRFTGPCEIAKRWMPYEISIVSVPADSSVGVGRELDDDETPPQEEQRSEAPAMLSVYESIITANRNLI